MVMEGTAVISNANPGSSVSRQFQDNHEYIFLIKKDSMVLHINAAAKNTTKPTNNHTTPKTKVARYDDGADVTPPVPVDKLHPMTSFQHSNIHLHPTTAYELNASNSPTVTIHFPSDAANKNLVVTACNNLVATSNAATVHLRPDHDTKPNLFSAVILRHTDTTGPNITTENVQHPTITAGADTQSVAAVLPPASSTDPPVDHETTTAQEHIYVHSTLHTNH